jgi:hypothetical protein
MANRHVVVTNGTKAGRSPASTAYLPDVLDGYRRMIRSTCLVNLVNTMDPKLVAAAFGMDPQATLLYLADRVDQEAGLASRTRVSNEKLRHENARRPNATAVRLGRMG